MIVFQLPLRYAAPPGRPGRTSATDQADELEIDTVDGVPITRVALTKRYEPHDPSEPVLPEVVLHPVVEDNEELDEPSKGGEDHDVKTRATPSK